MSDLSLEHAEMPIKRAATRQGRRTRRGRMVALLCAASALAAAGCADDAAPAVDAAPGDARAEAALDATADRGAADRALDLTAALQQRGLIVAKGSFEFLDMSSCCQSSCLGNNPSSPYAAFYVPAGPGQSAPNENTRADGLSATFRLRADEAVLFVGPTPPEVHYFGFTPYLSDRAKPQGGRRFVAASLSETLNNLVIGVESAGGAAGDAGPGADGGAAAVFGRRTAIIAAADATTVKATREALIATGVPAAAINTLVFDPAVGHFGLDQAADTFAVLFRMALPRDTAARDAYVKSPGATLLRLSPKTAAAADPLPSPATRAKDTTTGEAALLGAVDQLQSAIKAAYPAHTATALGVDAGLASPAACVAGTGVCAYDNRDALYPRTPPRILFASDDDFYVVYGVDHRVAGKASYANVSVYAVDHMVGIAGVASDQYPGGAQVYLPGSVDAAKLYAYKIARSCGGASHCLEVPKGSCPDGIANLKLGVLAFRVYLEPTTRTAPDPTTLVRDRVLHFRKP